MHAPRPLRHPIRRPLAALAASLVLLAAACGDATGPADVAGTYALERLGPDALPASLGGTAGSGFTSLLAESLRLDAGGGAHLESRRHHGAGYGSNYDPADTFDYTVAGDGTWERRGDTVAVHLTLTGDRSPFGAGSYAGVLRLRPEAGGLTEYQDPLSSSSSVRVYRR